MSTSADDSPCVLVRADLRPSTYRALVHHAREMNVTVGQLLSRLADRAVGASGSRRTRYEASALDAMIRYYNAGGVSDNWIAKRLGVSQSTVSAHRRAMGLDSPTPRAPGSGRRSAT